MRDEERIRKLIAIGKVAGRAPARELAEACEELLLKGSRLEAYKADVRLTAQWFLRFMHDLDDWLDEEPGEAVLSRDLVRELIAAIKEEFD